MPFTFSHPAIVLPFKYFGGKRFSTTGLIIGSITPDFEYFLRFENWSVHSHKWTGVLWLDLPGGLILCFVFHEVIKVPLFTNLPDVLRKRVLRFSTFNWKHYFSRRWMTVVFSLLLGIASHLLWDRFTHQTYGFIENKPVPATGHIDLNPTSTYRIIQVFYSAFGLAVLAIAVLRLPPETVRPAAPRHPFWIMIAFFALSMLGLAIIFTGLEFMDWITAPLSSGIIALTASSFIMLRDKAALLRGWRM